MTHITHLLAFLLPLFLFLFWGAIGYPLLTFLNTRRTILRNLLLAPTFGMAITLLPVFYLNRIGIPVLHFALPLTVFYFLSIPLLWFFIRPFVALRQYKPFAGILFIALCLVGWPLLQFGFHWFSFVNDDMNNYCLGAIRFMHQGYSDNPNITHMINGQDYSQYFWIEHVVNMIRAGSELQLAWLSGTFKLTLSPIQVFMPLIVALHLCLVSASGALVLQNRAWRKIALLAIALVSISALTTLGTVYQLIAQVGGLALLITFIIFILQPFDQHRRYYVLRIGTLIALTTLSFLIYYPELTPVLGISYLIYVCLKLASGWKPKRTYFYIIITSLLFSIILLNHYLQNMWVFIQMQLEHSQFTQAHDAANKKALVALAAVFPYFLAPSGFANLFGIIPIAVTPAPNFLFFSIFFGIILFIVTFLAAIGFSIKKQYATTTSALTFFILGGIMLYKQSGFDLFKLAMYAQPFLFCLFATVMFYALRRYTKTAITILCALILLNLNTQHLYIERSLGTPGIFQELPYASDYNLPSNMQCVMKHVTKATTIVYATPDTMFAKIMAQYDDEHRSIFLSKSFFHDWLVPNTVQQLKTAWPTYIPSNAIMLQMVQKLAPYYKQFSFNIHNKQQINPFRVKSTFPSAAYDKAIYIFPINNMSILNRSHKQNPDDGIEGLTYSQAKNYLIFINSEGQYYYNAAFSKGIFQSFIAKSIGLYQMETDYFYPQYTIARIGHYLLFQIIDASPHPRMILNLSTTQLQNKNLPSAILIGKNREKLPIIGSGSARVISNVFQPQVINGASYAMLDVDIHEPTYTRNISVISDKKYTALTPPSSISHFPTDLANPNLFYSGIYENGWISQNSYLYLSNKKSDDIFRLKGSIPLIDKNTNYTTTVMIKINDQSITSEMLHPGNFDIKVPYKSKVLRKDKVDITFSNAENLPNSNNQIIGAQIDKLGFFASPPINAISHFPNDLSSNLVYSGIYQDGWVSKDTTVYLKNPSKKSNFEFKGLIPVVGSNAGYLTTARITINNKVVASRILHTGNFDIKIPLKNIPLEETKVAIHFSKTEKLPNPDNRNVGALIIQLGFTPSIINLGSLL